MTSIELFFKEVKKILITLLVLDALIIVGAICFKAVGLSLFIGIILGNVYTLLNFALLGTVVQNAVEKSEIPARRYMKTHYLLRFLLMAAVLAVGFSSPVVNGWCVAISILAPKLTYTAIGIYQTIFCKGESHLGNRD